MIAARLHDTENGGIAILLVIEPGNIEKLKKGEPIHKYLNEFLPELTTKVELLLAYTPDAVWVSEQLRSRDDNTVDTLATVLNESLSRPEVIIQGPAAENLKQHS